MSDNIIYNQYSKTKTDFTNISYLIKHDQFLVYNACYWKLNKYEFDYK